jgi:hypothetical protein
VDICERMALDRVFAKCQSDKVITMAVQKAMLIVPWMALRRLLKLMCSALIYPARSSTQLLAAT